MKRSHLSVLSLALILVSAGLFGEPRIQRFVGGLSDYRFVMTEQRTDPVQAASYAPFKANILEEALLQNLSLWRIRSGSVQFELLVYETLDPAGAFELFTLWPEPSADSRPLDLPTGTRFSPRQAIFWRGEFFCRIRPLSGDLSPQPVSRFIEQFVEAVPSENLLPVSASHLPEEGRIPGSVRFYLGPESLALNDRFPDPLLEEIGFSDRIEIAYASYDLGEEGIHPLFLIGYPTPSLAEDYLVRLQNRLKNFFSPEGIYMKRAGVLIAVFAGSEEAALTLLPRVKYAPTIQWLYEKEPEERGQQTRTFLGLITKAILGTGTMLLIILAIGFVVGLARYEVLQRFPSLGRRKEIVRLHLRD